jgi:hypothetical protein
VGNDAKLALAIRTVAVTTRVAVRSHSKRGDADLAVASAERGLQLLDQIAQPLEDPSSRIRELLDAARRELTELANADEAGMRAFSVDADEGSVKEDVDVRSKLRP